MKMLIGLTGRTGSGKSSAAKIFESLGAFVANCDKIAHEVLRDEKVRQELCVLFSSDILDKNGEIDRKTLGSMVFSDKKKLNQLNGVVHGAIVKKCVELCESSGKDICLMDGSELESSGADKLCRHIIVISGDEETRLARIMSRDNIDRDSALSRIKAQSDYSKEAIIIDNSESEEVLSEKIVSLYNQFLGEINE